MLKISGSFFQGLSSKTSELRPDITKILQITTNRNREHTGQYFNAQNAFVETPSGTYPGFVYLVAQLQLEFIIQ
jgi:hypothetical protein